jgi:hypothetical protein
MIELSASAAYLRVGLRFLENQTTFREIPGAYVVDGGEARFVEIGMPLDRLGRPRALQFSVSCDDTVEAEVDYAPDVGSALLTLR